MLEPSQLSRYLRDASLNSHDLADKICKNIKV